MVGCEAGSEASSVLDGAGPVTLPERNSKWKHLKMDGWKMESPDRYGE